LDAFSKDPSDSLEAPTGNDEKPVMDRKNTEFLKERLKDTV